MRTPPRAIVAIIAPRDEPGRVHAVNQSKVASAGILNRAHSLVDDVCSLWALLGGTRRLRFGIVAQRLSFGIIVDKQGFARKFQSGVEPPHSQNMSQAIDYD